MSKQSQSSQKRDIKEVWVEYKKSPSERVRNILMENYLHLVRYNAERIHLKLPDEVELDDLMQAGIFGLMDAIDAFKPEMGIKFETFSAQRIRGSILDELRSMDWVPRLVRSRAHKLDHATRHLELQLGRRHATAIHHGAEHAQQPQIHVADLPQRGAALLFHKLLTE